MKIVDINASKGESPSAGEHARELFEREKVFEKAEGFVLAYTDDNGTLRMCAVGMTKAEAIMALEQAKFFLLHQNLTGA